MGKLNQAEIKPPQPNACGAKARGNSALGTRSAVKTGHRALVSGVLLAMASLTSCSDDQPRRQDSELLTDPAASTGAAAATEVTSNQNAAQPPVHPPKHPLTGAGSRYQVAVQTAYFFDVPEQSTPNGRYLRRGDTFYGQGETNGFVKTGFVQPNGVAGTAWLKLPELRKLAASPATSGARGSRLPRPARPPVGPAQSDESIAEATETADGVARSGTRATSGKTAVVQVDRSYFYNSADLATPRKAYCERGDKVRLGESRDAAVYVTFTNWEKVTTTGWMRKDALR